MKPYPLELRQRIVEAVDQKVHTIAEIADLFGVTQRYVYKLLRLRRETANLAPRPHAGGARAKLNEAKLGTLAELVAEFPDATLAELRELVRRRCRVQVCVNTVWRALQQLNLTLKKSPVAPAKPARKSGPPLVRNN
jgi:transposase